VLRVPIAHGEGRFILPKKKEGEYLKQLLERDQLVFRYCDGDGKPAENMYPTNPNGSLFDIAGICNPEGTVLGMMPHPERAYYGWQLPDWTRVESPPFYGHGKLVFESVVEYMINKT
jgi:phosphoribosylformylglycinamidine synthase